MHMGVHGRSGKMKLHLVQLLQVPWATNVGRRKYNTPANTPHVGVASLCGVNDLQGHIPYLFAGQSMDTVRTTMPSFSRKLRIWPWV